MGKVQLTAEIDEGLSSRVTLAAVGSEQSVSEWVENTLRIAVAATDDALGNGEELTMPRSVSITSRGIDNPPRLVGMEETAAEMIIEDRRQEVHSTLLREESERN